MVATTSGEPQYDAFYDPENEGFGISMKQLMIVLIIANVKFADKTNYEKYEVYIY